MKNAYCTALAVILLAGASVPVQAENVLGSIIGNKDSGALVTLGSGDAGNTGLVNVGTGGGNQVLDVQVGRSAGIASANVGSGDDGSLLDGDVNLLNGTLRTNARIGGGSLADIDVGIGGGGSGGNGPINGGPGNGGVGGIGLIQSAALGANGDACLNTPTSQIEQLLLNTRVDPAWSRASNVEIRRLDVCPEVRMQLSSVLSSSGLGPMLRNAIASDDLLSASISRSSYSADRVFAVQQRGNQLTVYVF